MSKIPKKEPVSKYKVLNWASYNQSLILGDVINFWLDTESISKWYHEGPKQKGGQYVY